MKKRLLVFILVIFSLFIYVGRVEAAEDHSFNYDIEEFRVDGDNLIISGWGFIHNKNNYGGTSDKTVEYTDIVKAGTGGARYTKEIKYNSDSYLEITFYLYKGDTVKFQQHVEFNGRDLTKTMCLKTGAYCYDDESNSPVYGYHNVGFTIKISINEMLKDLDAGEYSLKIGAVSGSNSVIEDLAVDNSLTQNVGSNLEWQFTDFGTEMKVTGNHVGFNNGQGANYWKMNVDYYYRNRTKVCTENGVDCIYEYELSYVLPSTRPTDADSYKSQCGWSPTDAADKTKINENTVYKMCASPGVEDGNYSSIKTTFIKPTGSVKLSIADHDKYCAVGRESAISDCNGAVSYSCSKFSVPNGEYRVEASPSETATLTMNSEYFNKNLYTGSGFDFGATYTDIITFKNINITKTNNNSKVTDEATIKKLLFSYIDGTSYGSGTYPISLSNKIEDKLNFKSSDDTTFNGQWRCSVPDVQYFSNENKLKVTNICEYSIIGKAYYDYKGDKIDYVNTDGVELVGNMQYIDLKYLCKTGNGKYEWRIIGDGTDKLALLKVPTGKNNAMSSPVFKIDIRDDSKFCYMNVYDNFYKCDAEGTSGSDYVRPDVLKFRFVYRSIDLNNPFPNEVKSDYKIPDNWSIDTESYKTRMKDSYGYMEYQTVPITDTYEISGNELKYKKWDDIGLDGRSNFIKTGDIFNITANKVCSLGIYDKGVCDNR